MSNPQFEEMDPVSGSSTIKINNQPGNSINLEAISNFRSLGGYPIGNGEMVVRPGVVCRSAGPTNATVSDEFWLLEVLNIKTLIDLRTSWENKTISPVRKFEDNFIQYSIKDDGRQQVQQVQPQLQVSQPPAPQQYQSSQAQPIPSPNTLNVPPTSETSLTNSYSSSPTGLSGSLSSSGSGNGGVNLKKSSNTIPIAIEKKNEREKEMEEQRNGILWRIYNRNLTPDELLKLRSHSSGVLRKRFCIPLINNKFFLEGVYTTAPNDTKMKCTAARYLLFNDQIGAYMLMNHLNDLGIIEMYKLTLIYTKEEILTIFRILKNPDNYPIMYYCSLGKDRTGMVTALLLSVLGVPRDYIVEDYAKSEVNIAPFMEQIRRYFTRVGLAKEEFVRSHRWTMEGLLSWVDKMYGSVSGYLDNIGFSCAEQDELRANLIVSKEEYDQYLNEKSQIPDLQKRHDEYVQIQKSKKPQPKFFTSASPRFWRRLSFSKDLQFNANDNSR
ncbi:hypothetical protein DICPUDRAFT_91774 [Dictyostelium purpureum]|uniref:Protein-tyrosine phosphatase catalytic domain-containing protein n=1 Tax=Dictyostelium purpureum TaxID=5786 RepID=F0ZH05_DICPU|nr:uncharacterized protein DICPUDRAFT_91774 [Dictyostelium purpureum]EGC36749.1 hypothetical protein DICPUDRAFT_91774 [Dictyostelium purpureum]|eukprot:XP_003286695.1 hypothetical protein DICPUDRAFT_91774 [Dictyostelium purpureum]